ncbi:MAG: hypothetical protein JWN25_1558, partial [Verrucomicrobiales bacterium]|nr:hypothetical protein [Verrucomicrobiales bacterium]
FISNSRAELDKAYVQLHPDARPGSFLCLSIRDTGTGMRSETMSRIFEPFFTTKEVGKGTGLGLATAYAVVQQHQGWIQVSSALGEGTEFKVFFPEMAFPIKTDTEFFLPLATRGGNETILVVEDELPLRSLVKTILQKSGYRILEAGSGIEALQVWNAHGPEIDLVLTDMVMPDGLSGKDLAEKLRVFQPDLKVIFSSGYSLDVADGGELYREGYNLLSKPYHPATLSRVVRNALDSTGRVIA